MPAIPSNWTTDCSSLELLSLRLRPVIFYGKGSAPHNLHDYPAPIIFCTLAFSILDRKISLARIDF